MDIKEMLGRKKAVSPEVKEAKLKALKEMRGLASNMMGEGLKGHMAKATVVSDSPEGLESGLQKAKEIVSEPKSMMESAEEALHSDLDGDDEEGESMEHIAKVMGDQDMSPELSDSGEEDDDTEELVAMVSSPEQADELIKKLLAKKQELTPKY